MGRVYREIRHSLIPIIDGRREIVGWTSTAPEYLGTSLHHPDAEGLVGPFSCLYVEIDSEHEAQKAGAPPGWIGPWRCLALCSVAMQLDAANEPVRVVSARLQSDPTTSGRHAH